MRRIIEENHKVVIDGASWNYGTFDRRDAEELVEKLKDHVSIKDNFSIRIECVGECGGPGHGSRYPFERCMAEQGEKMTSLRTGKRYPVVLTVAHLNHDPGDNRERNLKALCQRCHLRYDRSAHLTKKGLKQEFDALWRHGK